MGRRTRSSVFGLTLTEMIVVVAICSTLALLLMPMLFRTRASARNIICADNLRCMGQAFAVSMVEADGYLPFTYYKFTGDNGKYVIDLRKQGKDPIDTIFTQGTNGIATCPTDPDPVNVSMVSSGQVTTVPASYCYNISLPLMFRNVSRVPHPAETVSFYDGDVASVLGTWQNDVPWAWKTVRFRHNRNANFLYMDGHVEPTGSFVDAAFDGKGFARGASQNDRLAMRASLGGLTTADNWTDSSLDNVPETFNPGETDGSNWVDTPLDTTSSAGNGDEYGHETSSQPPQETNDDGSIPGSEGDADSQDYDFGDIDSGWEINVNPTNSDTDRNAEFIMSLADGFTVDRDDLLRDKPMSHDGFSATGLEYSGPATQIVVRPKGNGNQNGLLLNGHLYPLENKYRYIITSDAMTAHLYNSKRTGGKAMGAWWIDIKATNANIEVQQ